MSWTAILAQCVMCYRSAAAQGAARGRVFDLGIVILLIPPALILTGILVRAVRSDADRINSAEPASNSAPAGRRSCVLPSVPPASRPNRTN
jgi:hypothetical protein